jgi:hypothetical protein
MTMRKFLALIFATALALPMSAQAANNGGSSQPSGRTTTTGATSSPQDKAKPKPPPQGPLLPVDGIKGESVGGSRSVSKNGKQNYIGETEKNLK